jgi:hypothetical protein
VPPADVASATLPPVNASNVPSSPPNVGNSTFCHAAPSAGVPDGGWRAGEGVELRSVERHSLERKAGKRGVGLGRPRKPIRRRPDAAVRVAIAADQPTATNRLPPYAMPVTCVVAP